MEENILNNIDMTQGVTPEGTPVDNKPMSDLTDIVKTRFADGEPPLDILVDLIMQGFNPDQMGMAFEEIGFDPGSYTQLLQDAEIKIQGMQQQQAEMQQQMPEQSAQPLPPVSEEELLAESERAAREIESQNQPQPMQYGSETTSYATGMPTPLYIPPIPRRGNLLGAGFMLADAADQFFSNKDRNGDGLMDGTFKDWSAKMARYKGKQNLNKTFDVDYGNLDPSNYVVNFNDFAEGNIRTRDQYINDLLLNSRVDFDPEANDYKSAIASNDLERKMIGKNNRVSGISLARFMENIDNMDPEERQMLLGAKDYESGTGLINIGNQYSSYNIAGDKALSDMYRRTMLGETENDQPLPAMISSDTPERSVVRIPPINDTQEGSNDGFKDWYVANATNPRLMGLNEAQLREIYEQESQFKYGGSTLPKAQWGWFEDAYDAIYDATDSGLRSIGNTLNSWGDGDPNYWDDRSRTLASETQRVIADEIVAPEFRDWAMGREGYIPDWFTGGKPTMQTIDQEVGQTLGVSPSTMYSLVSPKNWVSSEAGVSPLPIYDEEASFDKAFAQARKDLGRGKSFLYNGTRYTTNYKDEAPNDETEEILKRATKDLSDEETKRFREVWQKAGQPPLTLNIDDEKFTIPAFTQATSLLNDINASLDGDPNYWNEEQGWLDWASNKDRRRAHVNLINRDNKVYLGREGMTDEQVREKILDELAHNMQIRRDGTFESLYRFGKGGLEDWWDPKYRPYKDTSAFEGEAHEVIAPLLSDYVYKGGDFPEFKYGAELPKAQMMGEFDPNNPFGLPDFSQMGQTSYINPDTGMPYDAPLAANQGNPIMLDEATVTAPAMEGLQSKALTEIPIEMPQMNLAPIDFSRFQSPGVDLQSKALTEIPTETPDMNLAEVLPTQSKIEGLASKELTEIPIEIPEMKLAPINLTPPTTEQPIVTRRRQLKNIPKQIATFIQDNPYMQAYGDVSNFAVMGANLANEYFAEKEFMDYRNKLRNSTIADKVYLATEDPVNKRGTFDVNTGLAEPDNLVDYYAQAMYGREMYKKGGEFEPHMMFDPKTGKGYEARVPADHERMAKMGYLHKDEMSYGGEVEVDNDTLAALIAAGADIEML